jgi:alginate O-acetyltransferase complex protein AlgI
MVFNSITFLIFFLLFFPIYWRINNRNSIQARNILILIASYVFYAFWDWRFLGLLAFSSLMDYIIGLSIQKTNQAHKRKWLLISSLIINLGILGFFKYFNFFIESFVAFLSIFSTEAHINSLNIILPVGVSFYTFQSIAYVVSIYRKQLTPTTDLIAFLSYVGFFPQLVAGPIERPVNLLPQFFEKKEFIYAQAIGGLRLVLWGFFKKTVIADNFGLLADSVFKIENHYSSLTTFIGLFFFCIQIYCDFSGYSDIAKGIARLLGFDLMTNFRTPYFSKSFREFWHRWHISLSTWFRDYVYIPLGGNSRSFLRTSSNLFITFLISGLWHGPKITFLIWGALHGIALITENFFRNAKLLRTMIYPPLVFLIVCLLWLPFRAIDLDHLHKMTRQLFSCNYDLKELATVVNQTIGFIKSSLLIFIFFLFLFIDYKIGLSDFDLYVSKLKIHVRYITYYALVAFILFLSNYNVKPYFIYFQF